MEDTDHPAPFACDMSKIAPSERARHLAIIGEVFGAVQAVRELSNGYAFRLANEEASLRRAAAFIANERYCCPFFGFAIEIEPEQGALWLSLTGRAGVKPFIIAEIGEALTDSVAQQARFR